MISTPMAAMSLRLDCWISSVWDAVASDEHGCRIVQRESIVCCRPYAVGSLHTGKDQSVDAKPTQESVKVGRKECRPAGLDDGEIPGDRRKLRQFLSSRSSCHQKPSRFREECSPALVDVDARGPMAAGHMDNGLVGGPSGLQRSLQVRHYGGSSRDKQRRRRRQKVLLHIDDKYCHVGGVHWFLLGRVCAQYRRFGSPLHAIIMPRCPVPLHHYKSLTEGNIEEGAVLPRQTSWAWAAMVRYVPVLLRTRRCSRLGLASLQNPLTRLGRRWRIVVSIVFHETVTHAIRVGAEPLCLDVELIAP